MARRLENYYIFCNTCFFSQFKAKNVQLTLEVGGRDHFLGHIFKSLGLPFFLVYFSINIRFWAFILIFDYFSKTAHQKTKIKNPTM